MNGSVVVARGGGDDDGLAGCSSVDAKRRGFGHRLILAFVDAGPKWD